MAILGKPLAPGQKRVWDLWEQKKSRREIASILGISMSVVDKTLNVCRKKLGVLPVRGEGAEHRRTENTNPERAAAIIDAVTEPEGLQKLKEAYRECGLPDKINESLIRRLKIKYFGAVTETRALKTGEILDIINKKIHHASLYLDDKSLGEASARDLMLGMSALVEKRQLLRGEPTQIISDHERKKLHELLPDLVREAQRRGITVEGQVMEKTLGP